ncbi:MAG: recombination protein RecR [Deltaproteobacteria bacterium]|nr:MAG: recombination protein RecR [Deltaproteobacteria bacterium]
MSRDADPIELLIQEFSKFPGIGEKTASRLVFHLLRSPKEDGEALARAVLNLKEKVRFCSVCFNLTSQELCRICQDNRRIENVICVVEEPSDLIAIEKTGAFRGRYHILQGSLSPLDGIGPDNLKIRELLVRLQGSKVDEVIIATNPNVEGEATALYLQKLIKPLGIRITRIACGVPSGGELEYIDQVTIGKALENRREV